MLTKAFQVRSKTFANTILALATFALSIWLFYKAWEGSWDVSISITNAVELGVPTTVGIEKWIEIDAFFGSLNLMLFATINLTNFKILGLFNKWEKFGIFVAPLGLTSLTPLIGLPTLLVPIAVIATCVTLRMDTAKRSLVSR